MGNGRNWVFGLGLILGLGGIAGMSNWGGYVGGSLVYQQ